MTGFAQSSVNVYQNYCDEIIQELHAIADRNREKNKNSIRNVYPVYFNEIIQDLHDLADRNKEINRNSFSLENFLAKA